MKTRRIFLQLLAMCAVAPFVPKRSPKWEGILIGKNVTCLHLSGDGTPAFYYEQVVGIRNLRYRKVLVEKWGNT